MKPKKKPYWIEVVKRDLVKEESYFYEIALKGHNMFVMYKFGYCALREANQMAKRLAKNLGLEVRK